MNVQQNLNLLLVLITIFVQLYIYPLSQISYVIIIYIYAQLRAHMITIRISTECCTNMCNHLIKNVLPDSRVGVYLKDGSIRFTEPNSPIKTCFRLQMGNDFELSIAISPNKMFNREENSKDYIKQFIKYNINPKIVEIFIIKEPSYLEKTLGYDGKTRSFKINESILEEGFSELIDEILRIRRIVYGIVDEDESNLIEDDENKFHLQ